LIQNFIDSLNLQALLTEAVAATVAYLPSVVAAILILIAAFIISRGVRSVLRKAFQKADFQKVLTDLLVDTVEERVWERAGELVKVQG